MPADRVTSLSPWHVVLLLDDSDAIFGTTAAELNSVVREILAEMDVASKGLKPYFRLSIIAYGETATVLEEYKDAREIDQDRVATLSGGAGSPNLANAIAAAKDLLARYPGKPTDFRPYVFAFSAGGRDKPNPQALRAATDLKRLRIQAGSPKVVMIALGNADHKALAPLASTPSLSRRPKDLDSLQRLFPPIGTVAGLSRNGEQKIDDIIMNL